MINNKFKMYKINKKIIVIHLVHTHKNIQNIIQKNNLNNKKLIQKKMKDKQIYQNINLTKKNHNNKLNKTIIQL